MTIRDKIYTYFEQAQGLKVLFIFDPVGFLQVDIESVAEPWPDDYVYYVFNGDWFTTKVKLANEWSDKNVVLLFGPQWPEPNRKNQDACKQFHLLSVLQANMVFQEEDTLAFMQQRGIPAQFADFFSKHISELRREKFHNVLSPYYQADTFQFDIGYRGLISVYLDSNKMLEWPQIIARLIILSYDPQKALTFFGRLNGSVGKVNASDVRQAIDRKLISLVGRTYDDNAEQRFREVVEALKYNSITQWLSASKDDPYKHLKITDSLQLQAINTLLSVIKENTKLYAQFAPVYESLGSKIRENVLIETYGPDARYAHVSEVMCRPIIRTIIDQYLYPNPNKAVEKLHDLEVYIKEGSGLKPVLDYLYIVAKYYETTANVGTLKLNSPAIYVNKYISSWSSLDMLYRQAVIAFNDIPSENKTNSIEDIKHKLDLDYASLSNDMNTEWVRCMKDFGDGFGSLVDIEKQSDFYANHLNGIKSKVAVIVSDALRYEMAIELLKELTGKKHTASLTPMLAGLPTETKYCKPTLLPHNSLECTGDNLTVDGTILDSTAKRTAQLKTYNPQGVCIDYPTLWAMPRPQRKKFFSTSTDNNILFYVFHNTIDDNCHGCTSQQFADTIKRGLKELKELITFIHDDGNVMDVYLTSDHGYVYNDIPFEDKDKVKITVPYVEHNTRYMISEDDETQFGVVKFPLSSVSPMSGSYFVGVPTGTNRFSQAGGDYQFAHGGASLQEVIIPLLYSRYHRVNEKSKVSVTLLEPQPEVRSSQLKIHLVQGEPVSMEIQERKVKVAIYIDDKPISAIQTITLNSHDEMGPNRIYEVILTVNDSATSSMMQLKVYDDEDNLNPLIVKNIINTTLIEQDF